ncbi:catalase A [Ancistrocladus abbreviatus]
MVNTDAGNGNGNFPKNKGFRMWNKNDFFPEESFQSWKNYSKALSNTGTRLKDRVFTRSLDHIELNEVRAHSQHEMKKTLNWWDLIWFGVGAVMGAGVFVLTGEATRNYAGPAVIVSYLISGIAAMLSVVCYTEFAIELPVAGGSFSYLRVELGDFMAYIAAGNIIFEYIVAGAGVARSWTSYFATLCNHKPDDFRIHASALADKYSDLDPIAVVMSFIIGITASLSIKGSSRFNSIATIVHILVMVFILIAGFSKANPSNIENFAPYGAQGILQASAMLFFAYIGFDGVATLGEEIKNPGRDIPIGLIGSMSIVVVVYCLMATVLCLMQPYSQVDVDAPYTLAFVAVGLGWAKYIVALGALKGMTTVLLANVIGQARYFTHIARTHLAPPVMAVVNKKTGTPVNATMIMTVLNSIVAFFTSLDVLSNLLSISTLFIFSLVALALIVRRYYVVGETSYLDRNKLIGFLFLIILSAVASAACWATNTKWIAYVVTGPVWFLATLGLKLTVKEARQPKLFGVPWMPWLPSASIAINVFIMGSIDGPSFFRFLIWTGLLLAYYVFVGLHASYDAAKQTQASVSPSVEVSVEEGIER